MRLHLLITLVKISEYFRFIESLRTCIMASQDPSQEGFKKSVDRKIHHRSRRKYSRLLVGEKCPSGVDGRPGESVRQCVD